MIKVIFIINLFFAGVSYGQLFELTHDNEIRNYWVDYPDDEPEPVPLVISMHGLGQTIENMRNYSQMTYFASDQGIAVVYPQGLNFFGGPAWNAGVYWSLSFFDDVGYINALIDSVSSNFSIDSNRIYACGMSNGGYMAYDLSCELADRIVAFGSVTGNFMLNSEQDCTNEREIPIIHIHGTSDGVINYYPPTFDGSLSPNESIDFWIQENDLTEESYEPLNDYVHFYTFYSLNSNTKFMHIKVDGGTHEWFGYDWGFHSSEELLNFFMQYSMTDFYEQDVVGDINNDGVLSFVDIILVINHIIGTSYLDNEVNTIFDIDGNSTIDIYDIILAFDMLYVL